MALLAAGTDVGLIERQADEVDRIGAAEILGSSQVAQRVLARDVGKVRAFTAQTGATAAALRAVRDIVAGLDPSRFDLGDGAGRGGATFAREAARAEERMTGPIATLNQARSELQHDNAVMAQDERALWLQMRALRGYAELTQRLDGALEDRIRAIAATESARARLLTTEALFPIRLRRREILTHLAVAAQGYAALRVIEGTNADLIRTIDTAVATTIAAVRAAARAVRVMTTAELVERARAGLALNEELTRAGRALDAVEDSELTVLEAVQSTLKAIRDDAATRSTTEQTGRTRRT